MQLHYLTNTQSIIHQKDQLWQLWLKSKLNLKPEDLKMQLQDS